MAELREVINNLRDKFTNLTLTQKLLVIGIPTLALVFLILIATLATKPNYTTLYAGLSQEDMSAIMAEHD